MNEEIAAQVVREYLQRFESVRDREGGSTVVVIPAVDPFAAEAPNTVSWLEDDLDAFSTAVDTLLKAMGKFGVALEQGFFPRLMVGEDVNTLSSQTRALLAQWEISKHRRWASRVGVSVLLGGTAALLGYGIYRSAKA